MQSEVAKDVVVAPEEKGAVTRGWIGLQIQPVTQDIADSMGLKSTKGALVASPAKGGPAEGAGFKSGDVITSVNGEKVEGPREFSRKISALGAGEMLGLSYLREGSEKSVTLRLGTLPAEQSRATAPSATKEADKPQAALGLEFGKALRRMAHPLSDQEAVKSSAVIVSVAPHSDAAEKRMRAGEVVTEINQEPVTDPADAVKRITALKEAGKKSVLFIIANGQGDMRFVALPLGK